ncbi:hypothetical protein [Intrasporangium sp. YIM S08009]|uniref:hypothetical protein n=1 Tax=Intrasporangium zincisolvens TaxID=3080018 RepID=UPI002B0617AC|nr:hypothetical protein [Intrasporangium sp. YIM S08009]
MTDLPGLRGRPATLAALLARHGARFVVVGSTARWLTTDTGSPGDLDVVVDASDLPLLAEALGAIGVPVDAAALARSSPTHVDTSWGPLDVFVAEPPPSRDVPFDAGDASTDLPVEKRPAEDA